MAPIPGRGARVRRWCFVACCSLVAPAQGLEIVHNDVVFEDGALHARFEARIEAEAFAVFAVVSDFERLDRVSRYVVGVTVGDRDDSGLPGAVSVLLRGCVLVFCREGLKVSRVTRLDVWMLEFVVDGGASRGDFVSGRERIVVMPDGGGARLRYDAELHPGFRVPRILVPRLLAGAVHRELARAALRVEQIATASEP
jgi:hypothetical protein